MADPLIRLSGLSKRYPSGVEALRAVDLTFAADEFTAIIGPSGAGKSTLLRCLNQLIPPTAGRYLLRGEDVTRVRGARLRRLRQRFGMIFQQFHLVGRLTALQNVLAGRLRFQRATLASLLWPPRWHQPDGPRAAVAHAASLCRRFSNRDRAVAYACLHRVGIGALAFQRADQLSGGQQQRVAIARALAQEPEVFLADEPVASLDPRSADVVMNTLARIHAEQGLPVIVNLHQVELARRFAARIIGIADGRVVFDDVPAKLSETVVREIYGSASKEQPKPASPPTSSRGPILEAF